jgi:hypothetical protein
MRKIGGPLKRCHNDNFRHWSGGLDPREKRGAVAN